MNCSKAILILVVAAALASVAGCSGGGGGSDGDVIGGGGSTLLNVSFAPDTPAPGAGTVAIDQFSATPGSATVSIEVTDVPNVFGVGFDVVWDPAVAEYVTWAPGTLLESGGNQPAYQVSLIQPGLLVVGASRTGASGVDAVGSVPLIRLTLRGLAVGSTPVTLENASLLDGQAPPQEIPSLIWSGGTLTAQ